MVEFQKNENKIQSMQFPLKMVVLEYPFVKQSQDLLLGNLG